jgi:hypothetical protein
VASHLSCHHVINDDLQSCPICPEYVPFLVRAGIDCEYAGIAVGIIPCCEGNAVHGLGEELKLGINGRPLETFG